MRIRQNLLYTLKVLLKKRCYKFILYTTIYEVISLLIESICLFDIMPTFTMQRKQKVIKIRPRMMIGGGITGSGCWLSAAVLNKKRAGGRHCIRQGGEGGESGWGYGSGLFTAVRIARPPPPPIYHVDAVEDIVVCPLVAEEEEEKGRKPKEFSKII